MKKVVCVLLFLACGLSLAAADFPKNDITYSTEVVTPHIPWAKPLAGGPLKAFCIVPIAEGRDLIELMQRVALEPITVSIDRNWDVNCWGIGDFYGHEFRGDRDDFQTVYGYVERHLTSDDKFDVILLPGLNGWSRLTRASRDAILRRVQEGAGLVLIHPFVGDVAGHPFKGDETVGDKRIWEVSPLVNCPDDPVGSGGYPQLNLEAITKARWEKAAPHAITDGFAFELLPAAVEGCRIYKYEPAGQVLIQAGGHPVLAVKQYGKGRVVSLAYVEEGYIPEAVDPVASRIYWNYWEYYYSLLARCLRWAAGRDSDFTVESMAATSDGKLEVQVRAGRQAEVELEFHAGSEFEEKQKVSSFRRSIKKGTTTTTFEISDLLPDEYAGGRQIVNLVVREPGSGVALASGSSVRGLPQQARIRQVRPNSEVYREGDLIGVETAVSGNTSGLQMRISLWDELGRLIHRQSAPARGRKSFYCPTEHFIGKNARLVAELLDDKGRIVDQLRAKPVMVGQRQRRQREYQGLLSFGGSRHFFTSVRQNLLRGLAMDTGFTWGPGVNNDLDLPHGYFGVYWYDRGPTEPAALEKAIEEFQKTGDFDSLEYLTKKELYRRTGDKRFLVRTPSLDDPAVLEILASLSRTAARNKAVYNMDYYFVGDEGSLTSYTDNVDFCWGPHTLANFRKWLQGEYGSLEALNRKWGTEFKEWSQVVPYTTEEARKTGRFAPWADHRTYMEISFANAYKVVRDAVVQGDPDGHIAVSGTQVTNAYNGCDWYRLDQIIDHFLSYSGGNQWDFHRSFAKPGSMVGFWTGYGRSGRAVQHEIWSAAFNNVLYPNLFWSYSVFNPDFTFSKSGRDMGKAFSALRFEGIGKLLMEAQRESDLIAIHYSLPSVHAATILGYHPRRGDDEDDEKVDVNFPVNRDGWTKLLSDLGYSYDFLASEQIERGDLQKRGFKVLILPFSLALSPEETKAIREFVENGGVVLADRTPGLMDEHCTWQKPSFVDDFFGVETESSLTRAKSSGSLTVTPEGQAWGLDIERVRGLAPSGGISRTTSGKPLLMNGSEPFGIVRPVNKGWAVYLNLLLDKYPESRRKDDGGTSYQAFLSGILSHLGIRPAVTVVDSSGKPLSRTAIVRYGFGSNRVMGILSEVKTASERFSADGVTRFEQGEEGGEQVVQVLLPGRFHVTDARSGHYFGNSDRVRVKLAEGEAVILGLAESRPELSLDGPSAGKRGEALSFALSPSRQGKSLIRCHFLGPDGRFLPIYARNVLVDGDGGKVVFRSALNDPPGEYTLKVQDVVTGVSAETRFVLE